MRILEGWVGRCLGLVLLKPMTLTYGARMNRASKLKDRAAPSTWDRLRAWLEAPPPKGSL